MGFSARGCSITLFTYPYVVLPVRAALLNIDPALEESARSLGLSRWQVFQRVTLPQLRPALAAGMLLTALYTLSDFGVVAMMRYNAFTRAIYLNYTNSFNTERAAVLALVLVALTLVLLSFERRVRTTAQNYRIGTGAQRQNQLVQLGYWRIPALIFCGFVILLGVGIPMLVMGWWLTGHTMVDAVPVAMSELALNTAGVSLLAAVVIGLAALPLGLLATRATGRFSKMLVDASYLGNVLPGIVIGLALVFFGGAVSTFDVSDHAAARSGICHTLPAFQCGSDPQRPDANQPLL